MPCCLGQRSRLVPWQAKPAITTSSLADFLVSRLGFLVPWLGLVDFLVPWHGFLVPWLAFLVLWLGFLVHRLDDVPISKIMTELRNQCLFLSLCFLFIRYI